MSDSGVIETEHDQLRDGERRGALAGQYAVFAVISIEGTVEHEYLRGGRLVLFHVPAKQTLGNRNVTGECSAGDAYFRTFRMFGYLEPGRSKDVYIVRPGPHAPR